LQADAAGDAETARLRKELERANQDAKKMAADVQKAQQEHRNAAVEKERLSSQLEMLVTELSNRQVGNSPVPTWTDRESSCQRNRNLSFVLFFFSFSSSINQTPSVLFFPFSLRFYFSKSFSTVFYWVMLIVDFVFVLF